MVALLAIIVASIGDSSMSRKCYIKSRRQDGKVVSEAYAYGNSWKLFDGGDAVGIMVVSNNVRNSRHGLMVKLCNAGIIPVTQIDGLVLCFPDGNGGIEMIEECA